MAIRRSAEGGATRRRVGSVALPLLLASMLAVLGGGPATSAASAQEVANVQVGGQPVFPIAAGDTLSAAQRAEKINDAIETRIAENAPLAPMSVVRAGENALLLVGADTLLTVTPGDAEVATPEPLGPEASREATVRVAREWAEALRTVFQRLVLEERAWVLLQGSRVFPVTGTTGQRAARRADAIAIRIGSVAAAPGAAPPLRLERRDVGIAILAGDEEIARVTPADTAAFDTPMRELAVEWARAANETIEELRRQRSPLYLLRVVLIAALAAALALLIHWAMGRLERRWERTRSPAEAGLGLGQVIARWVVGVLRFLTWVGLAIFVLWLFPRTRPLTAAAFERGVGALRGIAGWLSSEGLIVVLILVVTFFVGRFASAVVRHLIGTFGERQGGRLALRAGTLAGTAGAITEGIVLFLGVLTVLGEMQIDLMPILAGAGVAGIALGFGVQTLIRDFFTGFFILLEDQYGVGDVVRIGDISGKVERFTLRITQIRSLDGSLTSIPNGEILRVTNLSKDWAQVVLDVNVELGEDVDRATEVISDTARELKEDWEDRILGEPEVLGVETVDPLAQAVTIRVIMKTAPLERWNVTRAMRRRVLLAFEQAGIRVPPRGVVMPPSDAAQRNAPPGP